MKWITCWNDLGAYGIEALTGESCGLGYRLLCDVTADGLRILERCWGVRITPAAAWNRGSAEHPHVGSVMLSPEMLVPVGVFALLESGCIECWLHDRGNLVGIERADGAAAVEEYRARYREVTARKFAYGGTAADRNVHAMTGRVS